MTAHPNKHELRDPVRTSNRMVWVGSIAVIVIVGLIIFDLAYNNAPLFSLRIGDG